MFPFDPEHEWRLVQSYRSHMRQEVLRNHIAAETAEVDVSLVDSILVRLGSMLIRFGCRIQAAAHQPCHSRMRAIPSIALPDER